MHAGQGRNAAESRRRFEGDTRAGCIQTEARREESTAARAGGTAAGGPAESRLARILDDCRATLSDHRAGSDRRGNQPLQTAGPDRTGTSAVRYPLRSVYSTGEKVRQTQSVSAWSIQRSP